MLEKIRLFLEKWRFGIEYELILRICDDGITEKVSIQSFLNIIEDKGNLENIYKKLKEIEYQGGRVRSDIERFLIILADSAKEWE